MQAQKDLSTAFTNASGRTPITPDIAGELGGQTLKPGVYHSTAAFTMTGKLTLDGDGDPNAVFIFQTPAAITVGASPTTVELIGGAQASRVFWQTDSFITLGAGAEFVGSILAKGYVTFGAGAVLTGRAMSVTAYVTLDAGHITTPRPPTAPTSVVATASNASASVSWTAPVRSGSGPISRYTIIPSPECPSCAGLAAAGLSSTVTGLTNGTPYTFTVTANNVDGFASPPSTASGPVTPKTVPTAPTGVGATADNARADVSWTAPANDGGSPVTSYTVIPSPACSACEGLTATGLSSTVTGLVNGTQYRFTVTATNVVGASAASGTSAWVRPLAVPSAPTGVAATARNARAVVSWTAPASDGGTPITGYTITSSPACPGCGGLETNELSSAVTGLTNGTEYNFVVKAINAVGASVASVRSATVLTAAAPDAPTGVKAEADNGQAVVSWTAPVNDGGSPVTGYTVIPSPACPACDGVASGGVRSTVRGLTNGQAYTFTVTATNEVGTSTASSAVPPVTPATVPAAPTGVDATGRNAGATLSWTPPTSNGGSAVTGYTISPSPACPGCTGLTTTGLSSTVSGLTNGQAYTFTVTATNARGTSAASSAVPPVTPSASTVSGVPTGVGAIPGDARATVSWTAPASDGGTPITGYTITPSPACPACTGLRTTGARTSTVAGLTNEQGYTFTVTATNAVGTSAPSAPSGASVSSAAVAPGVSAAFTGVDPIRVLDTRVGTGSSRFKLGEGKNLTLTIPHLPDGTTAVALNVTVTEPDKGSFLTVYPGGAVKPLASNLNFQPGQTIPNLVLVPVGPGNTVTFYNDQGNVDVIADLLGYYAPDTGALFSGVQPTRVLDTRVGTGSPQTKLTAGGSRTLTIPNLPDGTTAVALNVTVTEPDKGSFLTVYPGGAVKPLASNLNFQPGQTIPNLVLVPVGPGNTVTFYNDQGNVDVIADLLGYYAPDTGALFSGVAPIRVLDTRMGTGSPQAKVGQGKNLTLTIPNLPEGTTAVALNVTVTNPDKGSFLTVYQGGGFKPPLASGLNYQPGQTVANMVVVPVGPGNTVTFYNDQGSVDVIADLLGYYV